MGTGIEPQDSATRQPLEPPAPPSDPKTPRVASPSPGDGLPPPQHTSLFPRFLKHWSTPYIVIGLVLAFIVDHPDHVKAFHDIPGWWSLPLLVLSLLYWSRRLSKHIAAQGDFTFNKVNNPRITELWLRTEIHRSRTLRFGVMKWGIGLLSGVITGLYFVRRDFSKPATLPYVINVNITSDKGNLSDTLSTVTQNVHPLQKAAISVQLPFFHWIVGTVLLLGLAIFFWQLTFRLLERTAIYARQLDNLDSYSGIRDNITREPALKLTLFWIYMLFPTFDLVHYFFRYLVP